ncbi:MAG: molecular chaperone HtpG [Lachnoclostridium sp.]|nr:molecular chaperone HtpG [Lachnoclostridium sp.]
MAKTGSLSINSENIFPIIKKWLYSDHDIFYRELVSNGCDAITKLKKLALMGEYEEPENPEYKVCVTVNPTDKTIKITDNGLGMTEEEVEQYINQIAFSGAMDFMNKYKDKANEDQIIGHFGLGFYSAFMVADKVTIDTLSYQNGAKAVHWESEGGTEFEMTDGDKETIGTTITLYLNDESTEFSNEFRAREVLDKYCAFMPVEIFLNDETVAPMYETIEKDELTEKDKIVETIVEEAKIEEKENEDGTKEIVEISPATEKYKIEKRPIPVNDTKPLWNKHPNECTEEEYKEFYRKVFMDFKEPLFWIHLNMDYPFNLKGILYFPKINMEYESIEGKIKLFNNQVFIADNIKEVIPEFLMLLKGTIDCPDLPLNVSRSALQNDGFVKKISDYITKKVADKLSGMCKTDRENYEKYWDDINPFIKFGCLKDEKFADKMNDYIVFKNLDGKYLTLKDCLEENKEKKHENQVFYVTDEKEQSQYINMFKEAELDAVILPNAIDSPFISHLEQKNEGVKFLRIDADVSEIFKVEEGEPDEVAQEQEKKNAESLTEIFRKALGNDNLDVKVEKLKNAGLASMITVSEESRRMQDMMKMYAMYGGGLDMFPVQETLVLNANNDLVKYVLTHGDGANTNKFCEQLYDLAKLAHGSLSPERMTKFIARSGEIMMMLTEE